MSLPLPANSQAYFCVSALEGGILKLPTALACKDAPPDAIMVMPCLAFLLVHSDTGHKFLFDLSIRKDWGNYPPAAIAYLKRRPAGDIAIDQDVVGSLAKGGTLPSDIDTVCLSHVHFDHTGNPSLFTTSTFVVGAETEELLKDGYPQNHSSRYASDLLPKDRTRYLSSDQWKPIGPFPRALDFFDDGSLYIVDAPGHIPGHINILARTSTDGGWIYLAGDSIHHRDILEGRAEVADRHPVRGSPFCLHENKEVALETIGRIHELMKIPRVRVLLAHDEAWYEENKGGEAFWPGTIRSL